MQAVEFEELAWQWREALQAAANATAAASRIERHPPKKLAGMDPERAAVERSLAEVALTHHLPVGAARLALATGDVRELMGVPRDVTACVFNLDGVLIPSAAVHAAAWRETFDRFLLERSELPHGRFEPFDLHRDYYAHIHARPRLEGVRSLLASRGIRLPEGTPSDPPELETVHGLANRKKEALLRRLRHDRVNALEGSRYYLEAARQAGVHRVVVSASANALQMLEGAGLDPLVEQCVDGKMMEAEHLHAKPAPDTLIAACAKVAAEPSRSVAYETTASGVAAARGAGFELVVGVAASEEAKALLGGGADRVVESLAELLEKQAAA